MTPAQTWNPTTPLATMGTWLLEASAGTGKTWQLASLVTRLVIEPDATGETVPIERILVITFTRAATAELRDRVRKRLGAVRTALEDPAAHRDDLDADPVLRHLVLGPDDAPIDDPERRRRAQRATVALSSFDLAPISTIHGFCQRMLDTLAFESGQDAELTLLEDTRAIVDTWVADNLVQVQARATELEMATWEGLGWAPKPLTQTAKAASGALRADIEPVPPPVDDPVGPVITAVEAARSWWRAHGSDLQECLGSDIAARSAAWKANRISGVSKAFDAVNTWLHTPGKPKALADALRVLTPADLAGRIKARHPAPSVPPVLDVSPVLTTLDGALADLQAAAPLARFAHDSRRHLDDELVRLRALSFDAMLVRLADRVRAGGPDGPLSQGIRSLYDTVFIDEFQDTDQAQWAVLKGCFHAQPGKRLFLIGDPKQAIYAFRGADVFVYLSAKGVVRGADDAGTLATMRRNHRSDAGYVAAMNRLWGAGSRAFGDLDMDYIQVDTPPGRPQTALAGGRAPFEARWLCAEVDGGVPVPIRRVPDARQAAADACAAEVRTLVSGAHTLTRHGETKAVVPGDIAVLVNTHRQAAQVKRALGRHGVLAVTAGKGSVFESPTAAWLLAWLDAVARPGHDGLARNLAVTPLFGWSLAALERALEAEEDRGDDAPLTDAPGESWAAWRDTIQRWAKAWGRKGFAQVFQSAMTRFRLIERVLTYADGERLATDLRHLLELGHTAQRQAHLGPAGLASWLRKERAGQTESADTTSLRLESDAQAVQIVTLHKSKGLQYPIVLLPFAWDHKPFSDKDSVLVVHPDRQAEDWTRRSRAVLDLHPSGSATRKQRVTLAKAEAAEEDLRKLYVALTRAEHHCVAWMGLAGQRSQGAALHQLTLRQPDGDGWTPRHGLLTPGVKMVTSRSDRGRDAAWAKWQPAWGDVATLLDQRLDGHWSLCPAPTRAPGRWTSAEDSQTRPLTVSPVRIPDLPGPWTRTSFSAMAAERTHLADEPMHIDIEGSTIAPEAGRAHGALDTTQPSPTSEPGADALPLGRMTGGTVVGTWAHAVLEHLDFTSPLDALHERASATTGPPRDAATLVATLGRRHGHNHAGDHDTLLQALGPILTTPMGVRGSAPQGVHPVGLPADWTLAQLPDTHRLDELRFDLSLAGGDQWTPAHDLIRGDQVSAALGRRAEAGPWDGQPWLDALLSRAADPAGGGGDPGSSWSVLPAISGILTGAIDLVFRVDGRYYLADWKTNRLVGKDDTQTRPLHYTRPWMAWAMAKSGYHLQALIYTVALHRFLRVRLRDYDYNRHIGGHLYLFLRGMTGPGARLADGQSLGVYQDRWPEAVVTALDRALDGSLDPRHLRPGAP